MLMDLNQGHLFEHWPEPGVDDDEKRAFLEQVISDNATFCFFWLIRHGR